MWTELQKIEPIQPHEKHRQLFQGQFGIEYQFEHPVIPNSRILDINQLSS